ncbi:MAG TPA: serine/threonine-protein kinase [Ktedonobacteraceae bacterium]|nr:serine/threonine-protein kinase [Ktedonobacteraceae bacterium]
MLPAGMQLGRYRIVRMVGKGTSEVYLAEDPSIPRDVAIKVMQTEETQFANTAMLNDAVNAFQREAQLISRLSGHVHILALFDYGQVTINGIIYTYLVMPYQQEGTLSDWLHKRSVNGATVLTPLEASKILNLAADALQYAHNQGVVHRDIKPSNFLIGNTTTQLGDSPPLLLADFGIARLQQNISTTQPIGTPYYMAPEQWTGHPVPATDQYALAIIIFLLITGKFPFEGDLPALAIAHTEKQPPRPGECNNKLSHDIDKVLLRALAKKPHKRYSSVTEFAQAFEEAANKDKQEFQQIGTIPARPNTRLSLIAIIAALLVLIIFATSGGTLFYLQQRNAGFSRATATAATMQKTVVAQNNATRTAQMNATATAQAHATATALSHATATALANTATKAYPFALPSSEVINELFKNDNFAASNPNGWETHTGTTSNCFLTPQGYSLTATNSNTSTPCFADGTTFSNFTFQANFQITRGNCAGIIFRSNNNNANYYIFSICTDGSFGFYNYANKQKTSVDNGTSPNIRTALKAINVIAVVAKGTSLQFYVNSSKQAIYTTTDNAYTGGEIGVIATDTTKPTTAIFLVAQVYRL